MEFGENELRFDQDELKVLASDTRVKILKSLKERNYTVSELSKKLGHSKSTLHEHLSKLKKYDLIQEADNHTNKWVYYTLSRRGKELFVDSTKRVVVVLSSVLLVVGLLQLGVFFSSLPAFNPLNQPVFSTQIREKASTPAPPSTPALDSTTLETVSGEMDSEKKMVSEQEVKEQSKEGKPVTEPTQSTGETKQNQQIPYLIGGIGFISAAIILVHYYHTKPMKLKVEKKKK